jgi:RNA ligase-like protein
LICVNPIAMALEIAQYLRAGNSLEKLQEEFAISPRRHRMFPNLVLLKYSQINSPMSERIVQECRGIILDESENWRPVCVPYFKFFNYREPNAAAIDWATARVQEKLDGSLMTLYHYDGEWRVSSSGLPDASGDTGFGTTFAELFWQTWTALQYQLPEKEEENYCFMFELMTPSNRVVVPHQQSRIVLHGVRSRDEPFQERAADETSGSRWETVRAFPLGTIEEVISSCAAINPRECEGYVVVDAAFNRVKVKSPQYVALAHMKDTMSPRRMLEVVRANESEEFLTYFPQFRQLHEEVRELLNSLILELEHAYIAIKDSPDQKAFALQAVKTRCPAALFALRSGDAASIRDYFRVCTLQGLERVLGINSMPLAAGLQPPPAE